MEVERGQCLRIYAPEWYRREDFRTFLVQQTGHPTRPLATWHYGAEPHDLSDVFMTLDGSDLSEADLLPADIADAISDMARTANVVFGVVWLSNSTKKEEQR